MGDLGLVYAGMLASLLRVPISFFVHSYLSECPPAEPEDKKHDRQRSDPVRKPAQTPSHCTPDLLQINDQPCLPAAEWGHRSEDDTYPGHRNAHNQQKETARQGRETGRTLSGT